MCPTHDRGAAVTRSSDPPSIGIIEERSLILSGIDHVCAPDTDALTARERAVVSVATTLEGGVDAATITALVRRGGEALDCVREALEVLGELDPQLLARVALDALVHAHGGDVGAA